MMDPSPIQPRSNIPPLTGTLAAVPDCASVTPSADEPSSVHIQVLEEAIACARPLLATESAALYARIIQERVLLASSGINENDGAYSGQPGSCDLFHTAINKAIERCQSEVGLVPNIITSQTMLGLFAAFPDYTTEALDVISSLGARITRSDNPISLDEGRSRLASLHFGDAAPGLPFAPYWKWVPNLVLDLTIESIHQGRSLTNARFWHQDSRGFMSVQDLISHVPTPPSPRFESSLMDWMVNVRSSARFWTFLYDGLNNAPCSYRMPQLYRDVREHLEADFRNEWLNTELIGRIARWNCFLPKHTHTPSAKAIANALAYLFPNSPTDPTEKDSSCLGNFGKAVISQDAPQWISKIPLHWAAALYRVYFESQKGQIINNAPFEQMLLSVRHYPDNWDEIYPDFLSIINQDDPVLELRRRENEMKSSFADRQSPPSISNPISVLLTAKVLGFGHSDFEPTHSLGNVLSTFSEDEASSLIAPIATEWRSHHVRIPRVKILRESATVSAVHTLVGRRLEDDRTYFQIGALLNAPNVQLSFEQEQFLNSPIGQLWNEMAAIERYFWKLYRLNHKTDTRDAVISLVELLSEVCNGGASDDIECVRDPHFLAQLKKDLELDALIEGVRDEFISLDKPSNITTNTLEVAFKPTRGILTEFVGHLCDTCFSRVSGLAKNAPWVTFVPFVKNPNATGKDGVFPAFAGGSLVIETEAYREDGYRARVFLIRGYNPASSLLKTVHAGSLFDEFSRYLVDIAKARGVSHILVPEESSWGLSFTNRPYAFLDVEQRFYADARAERMSLVSPQEVALNGLIVNQGVVVATTK